MLNRFEITPVRRLFSSVRGIVAFIPIHSDKLKAKLQRRKRIRNAKAFNDRYTFHVEWVKDLPILSGTFFGTSMPRGGFAWMCPECNKVHHPYESSVWSGLQYPRCCSTEAGHRLSHGISLPSSYKQ